MWVGLLGFGLLVFMIHLEKKGKLKPPSQRKDFENEDEKYVIMEEFIDRD